MKWGMYLENIYNAIKDFFNAAKGSMTNWWEKLTKSPKINRHHIVAKAASRAYEAQEICKELKFNYKVDSRNLVDLKARFHNKLHTTRYYKAVNACVKRNKNNYNGLIRTLFTMKTILRIMNVFS